MLDFVSVALASARARLSGAPNREAGVTAVEYALMVAIIAVLLVGAYFTLFNTIKERFTTVSDCVANAPSNPAPTACGQTPAPQPTPPPVP